MYRRPLQAPTVYDSIYLLITANKVKAMPVQQKVDDAIWRNHENNANDTKYNSITFPKTAFSQEVND